MEGTDPVKKKLVAALSGATALGLALTGCSDDGGEERDEWAKQVCDEVKPEVQKIQSANASIDEVSKKKPESDSTEDARKVSEEVKKTDSAAFKQISGAYESLAGAVEDAGAPPVDDGEKLHRNAVKELNSLSKQYSGLKTKVDKMDTKDQSEFGKGLKGIADELKSLGESGDKALAKLQSGELGEAMANQEGCKKPSTAPSPSS